VSIPAGNGKSTLAAAMGLHGLLADGVEGAQVLAVESDERQARIILNTARRMVELEPDLEARVHVYADRLHEPCTDSTFMALPADPGSLQGWDPSMAIVDELHVVTDDTLRPWPPAPASGSSRCCWPSRPRPRRARMTASCAGWSTTAGRSTATGSVLINHLTQASTFAAPAGCAVDDQAAWAIANPAVDDFLHRDALRATLPPKMRANAFRRYRLGQWVARDDAWLPDGAWAACADAARSSLTAPTSPWRSMGRSRATAASWSPPPSTPPPCRARRTLGSPVGPPRLARPRGRR
jgi:hypothetical protein